MYPFHADRSFVRDRWYTAAFAEEITRDPVERTIMDKPIIFFRKADGSPVAMYGLCPHRYYPLVLGKVDGNNIVCGYHGFTFRADGKCVRIPAQNSGASFTQPTYPLVERGPLVSIWLSDPAAADVDLIPPYDDFGLCQEGWAYAAPTYYRLEARAQLLIDNLLDLTHLPYVHHHLPGGDAHLTTNIQQEQRNCSLRLKKFATYEWNATGDFMYGLEHRFEGVADRLSLTDFYGPEFIRTSGPIITALHNGEPVPKGVCELYFLHGVTPETEHTTHYFGFITRSFRADDPAFDQLLLEHDKKVREQDVAALGIIEPRLEEAFAHQRELVAVTDRGPLKVRELIQRMFDRVKSAV